MVGDRFLGYFIRRNPRLDDFLHGINDFIPATIIPGNVEDQTLIVLRDLDGILYLFTQALWQGLQTANVTDLNPLSVQFSQFILHHRFQ